MYMVSLGAVRRRSGPARLVALLAALLAAVASAAAWYGLTVAGHTAGAEVDAAPPAQRVITVHGAGADTATNPRGALDAFAATVRGVLPVRGAEPALGVAADTTYVYPGRPGAASGMAVAYRDRFCANARLTGTCPAAPNDAAISTDAARRLGLRVGGALRVRSVTSPTPLAFRITAIYQPLDPAGAYWSDELFRSQGSLDPFFTTLESFRSPELARTTVAYGVEVPAPLLRGDGGYDLNGLVNAAGPRLAAAQLDLDAPTGALVDAVRGERIAVAKGVAVALGQVAVLAWFAFALAGRFTGRERRADAGLLKLRGSTGRGILRLALGQHLIPLAAGGAAGWVAGFLVAWPLAGGLPVRVELWAALLLSLAAVLGVLAVALLVLLAVDALAQRAPVAVLLRRVPSARRDWRSGVVDAALVALAAGAVFQARTGGRGLGVVAPALVALAVGLVLARLLRWTADRAGGAALRAGRIRLGLTAVRVSRQPGIDRVFALVVVAVATIALGAGGYLAGRVERAERADVELGAPRVLTVAAQTRTQLLHAVRRADPTGRYAMAAVVDTTNDPPVLAVDSARLAAVATWRPEYGPVDALTRTAGPAPLPLVTGDRLTVAVTSERRTTTLLGATLQHEGTGEGIRVEFRGIRPGPRTVSAAVPGCAVAPGCRLVGWELFTPAGADDGAVTIRSLAQRNPDRTVLDGRGLADVTRWRSEFATPAVRVTAAGAGLTLATVPAGATEVAAVDSPLPLPVVLAGATPSTWRFDDAALSRFGDPATPVRVAATASLLPVLGGDGVLTDLDAARRVAGDSDQGGTLQVWLSRDAPASVVDALALPVLADRTATGRVAGLAAEGAVVTAPFALFAVVTALLLAAALVALAAAVDREPQLDQLSALRAQGLPRDTALASAYAGAGALAVAGLLGGLVAALVARPVAAVTAPPFPDGWRVLPPPGALGPAALGIAAVVALVVLGATAWLSVRRLRGGLS